MHRKTLFVGIFLMMILSTAGPLVFGIDTQEPTEPHLRSVPRTVLAEQFTATWCPHCPNADDGLTSTMTKYTDDELVVLVFHGSDDFAIEGGADRLGAYTQRGGFPTVAFDGTDLVEGGGEPDELASQYQETINSHLAEESPISLEMSLELAGSGYKVSASGEVMDDVDGAGAMTQENYELTFVVFDGDVFHDITTDSGDNGIFTFWNTARMILEPEALGEELNAGDTFKASREFTPDTKWNLGGLGVAAFVQNVPDNNNALTTEDTKILQASSIGIADAQNLEPAAGSIDVLLSDWESVDETKSEDVVLHHTKLMFDVDSANYLEEVRVKYSGVGNDGNPLSGSFNAGYTGDGNTFAGVIEDIRKKTTLDLDITATDITGFTYSTSQSVMLAEGGNDGGDEDDGQDDGGDGDDSGNDDDGGLPFGRPDAGNMTDNVRDRLENITPNDPGNDTDDDDSNNDTSDDDDTDDGTGDDDQDDGDDSGSDDTDDGTGDDDDTDDSNDDDGGDDDDGSGDDDDTGDGTDHDDTNDQDDDSGSDDGIEPGDDDVDDGTVIDDSTTTGDDDDDTSDDDTDEDWYEPKSGDSPGFEMAFAVIALVLVLMITGNVRRRK